MASKIDVFNMALKHIGNMSTVADEAEASPERIACSAFWETTLDSLLAYGSVPWNFATVTVQLAEIEETSPGWSKRYRYPDDCITAIRVFDESSRLPSFGIPVKFTVQAYGDGRSIVCDIDKAQLLYVRRVNEAERLPSAFVKALSYALAAEIAQPLKVDQSLKNSLEQSALYYTQLAACASLNESNEFDISPSVYELEITR